MNSERQDIGVVALEAINSLGGGMVFAFDAQLDVLLATGEVLRQNDWDLDSLPGRSLVSLIPPQQFARVEAHLRGALAGRTSNVDVHATVGEAIYATEFWPLRADDGSIVGGVAFLRDVTEQRAAEAQLARAREASSAEQALISKIRRALAEERFTLYAQPIFDLSSRAITSLELLIRLIDDDGSLLAPGAFLAVAEDCGLITQIDRWVLARAGDYLRANPSCRLSVNISGRSLADDGLEPHIEKILACPSSPSRLTLELTETAAVASNAAARSFVDHVRSLGCRVAIDDFGSGFATFMSLRELSFDELKIDGAVVRSLTTNHIDRVVVKAIADLARGLGKTTVAEFVGDEDTVQCLRDLGVGFGQGYGLARPTPLSAHLPAHRDAVAEAA